HLRLQFLPHLNHRQRHFQQLPLAEYLELRLGLVLHSLIAFLHSGSPLENRVCNPNSIRVRVESRCFLFQVSTKGGTTSCFSFARLYTASAHGVVPRRCACIFSCRSPLEAIRRISRVDEHLERFRRISGSVRIRGSCVSR